MNPLLSSRAKEWGGLALLVMTIAACGTRPVEAPRPVPAPAPKLEKHQVNLGDGVSVSYQVERKISAINGVSCYAFVSGTLNNDSSQILDRRTVIDFNFFSDGRQSFRDLTSPVSDIAQGNRALFEMVVSPVYRDGCLHYDRIEVQLRKVVRNKAD
jgi:hypothetical protein